VFTVTFADPRIRSIARETRAHSGAARDGARRPSTPTVRQTAVAQTLQDTLLQPGKRPQVVTDCEKLIDEEVAAKGGLSGLAIKGAFAMVKAVKPGMIHESVDALLDDFVARLQPFYAEWQANSGGKGVADYFVSRSSAVADALLGITDERAARSKNSTLKKAYEKLRPQGKKNVEEAVPRLGRLIERHTQ
jgi:hypothetical protein